jgi:hypothetical protein
MAGLAFQVVRARWSGLLYALTLIAINTVGDATGYPGTALIVSGLVIVAFFALRLWGRRVTWPRVRK